MSYRKITFDNKTYKYVIGERYFKVKDVGVFQYNFDYIKRYNPITPKDIKNFIKEKLGC